MNLDDRTPLVLRLAGVAALVGIFWAHALGVVDKLAEVLYLGFGYTLILIVAALCVVLLLMPSPTEQRWGWRLGGLLALSTLVAYILTRTTGLPQAGDDRGNWNETFAVWSTVAEAAMILLSAIALFSHRGHGPDTTQQIEDTP